MLNVFDIGIILLLVMFFITGFKNGVIRELFALVGIILVFILSFALKGIVGNFLCLILPFFNITGTIDGFSVINILIYQAIGFILVFGILLTIYEFIIKISRFIQKLVNLTIILIIPSKILGGIVSVINCWIVLFAVFIVLMIPLRNYSIFTESTMINKILYNTPILSGYTSNFTSSVEEIYDLGVKVSNKEISTNDANLKTLDIMLKHKVIDKNTIEKLINQNKLNDVKNINSVLNKY